MCPSDSSPFGADYGNDYRGNFGVGPTWGPHLESPDSGNGFYDYMAGTLSAGSFRDGLSQTMAYSERLRGSGLKPQGMTDRDDSDFTFFHPRAAFRTADYSLRWSKLSAIENGMDFTVGGFQWFIERLWNTS